MRLVVLGAPLLAALLSLQSAVAVRSAGVGSTLPLAVVATDSALLALAPGAGDGNAAATAAYADPLTRRALRLDFTRGLTPGAGYSFAPRGSTFRDQYRFRGLFTVTNRSAESLCVRVYVPGGGVADLAAIRLRLPGDGGDGTLAATAGGEPVPCSARLGPGESFAIDFWWEIESTSEGTGTFPLRVEAAR